MNERLKKDLDEMASILDEVKNQGLSYLDQFAAPSYLEYA